MCGGHCQGHRSPPCARGGPTRGGTRRCVLVCATQPGAGCGAQFCEEREPWGRWSWVRGGGGGAAGSCAGGGLHGCASSCVRDRRARAPRQRVCLGLSTFVSATIITPEVWARPCTRLSFVRGGGDAPWERAVACVPPPLPGMKRLSITLTVYDYRAVSNN